MMFDVITVIKECKVVDATVIARCSSSVLEISVKITEHEARGDSRHVDHQEESRRKHQEDSPKGGDENHLRGDRRGQSKRHRQTTWVAKVGSLPTPLGSS